MELKNFTLTERRVPSFLRISFCGGCGWNTIPANCFVVDRHRVLLDECDLFAKSVWIHNLDIGICSLLSLTHHFVGAWKFAGDSSILVHKALCPLWILKVSAEHSHKI